MNGNKNYIFYVIFLLILLFSINTKAQDSLPEKKSSHIKTIRDIPHKTIGQKWMWIHRSVVFEITKERKINYNTNYIKSNYKQLVITLPISTHFLMFSLKDFKNGNKLNFTPNLQYNLGISISSKWASFIINSGVKLYAADADIKGNTKQQDYQLNLYGRKFTTDIYYQYYKGFYIKNSKDYNNYISDKPFQIRSDIYALHMGVNSYYILNNKRFSYGSSFAFVDQQKKSAGSLLLGIYYSYFTVTGDPSLIEEPFINYFDTTSYIRSAQTHDFGINFGYIYTLVIINKLYATGSLVQGIGAKHVAYKQDNNSNYNQLIGGAGKLHARMAIRFDNGKYFITAMGIWDHILLNGKSNSNFEFSYGKFIIGTGYRFSILKSEKNYFENYD